MKPSDKQFQEWEATIKQVASGMSKAEVEERLGERTRVVSTGNIEIWAWDRGQFDGTMYSIRVAFTDERVCQAYLGMELSEEAESEDAEGADSNKTAGVLMLLFSVPLIYLGMYRPISDAINHEPEVTVYMKLTLLVPISVALGLVLTIYGKDYEHIWGPRGRPSRTGWLIIAGSFALGGLLYWLVERIVAACGYS